MCFNTAPKTLEAYLVKMGLIIFRNIESILLLQKQFNFKKETIIST